MNNINGGIKVNLSLSWNSTTPPPRSMFIRDNISHQLHRYRATCDMAGSKCCIVVLLVLGLYSVEGIPLANFYTFGGAAGDASLRPNDDDSSPAISLNVPFPFFDILHSTVYVRSLI